MDNASGKASSAKCATLTGIVIVIVGATQGNTASWKRKIINPCLLPPVILLDDRLCRWHGGAKGNMSCHHPNNNRDAALTLGVHVSNPDFVVRGPAIYLPKTVSYLSLNEGADYIRLMACSAICACLAWN